MPSMLPIRGLVLLMLAALLSGCARTYPDPRVFQREGLEVDRLPGLMDLAVAGQPLDVLLVHGMCTKTDSWPREAIRSLASILPGSAADADVQRIGATPSGIAVHQSRIDVDGVPVRLSALHWSPVTRTLKAQLCHDQTDKSTLCRAQSPPPPPYPHERSSLNARVKDLLLNDCLADAIIYQGQSRDAINREMQQAVLMALAPDATPETAPPSLDALALDRMARRVADTSPRSPVVFVTDSLGSKVGFDAVTRMLDPTASDARRAAGQRIAERTAHVYMRSNQLPILALADTNLDGPADKDARPAPPSAAYAADPLAALASARRSKSAEALRPDADPRLKVTAFTDPDDLLSYALLENPLFQAADYTVVDVIVSNSGSWFGLLQSPVASHLNYARNEGVNRLLVQGCALREVRERGRRAWACQR